MGPKTQYTPPLIISCAGCHALDVLYVGRWCRTCYRIWPEPIRRACEWGYPATATAGQDPDLLDVESVNLESHYVMVGGSRIEFYSATIESDEWVKLTDGKATSRYVSRKSIEYCGTSSRH